MSDLENTWPSFGGGGGGGGGGGVVVVVVVIKWLWHRTSIVPLCMLYSFTPRPT